VQNATSAGTDTSAASLAASGELGPSAKPAVDGARPLGASHSFGKGWARQTAKLAFLGNVADAGLGTMLPAGCGALGEHTEVRNFAVHRARHSNVLARLSLLEVRAGLAASCGGHRDGPPALAVAGATAEGASGPATSSTPSGHNTVNGASLRVARLGLLKSGARSASTRGFCDHVTSTFAHTDATAATAQAPLSPLGGEAISGRADFAVDRAALGVALALFDKRRARLAAEDGSTPYSTLAELAAGVAGLAALSPGAVIVDLAVGGALLCVAAVFFGVDATTLAAVHGIDNRMAAALLVAYATGGGALIETRPLAHATVDRARLGVALSSLPHYRADSTMTGFPDNFASAFGGAGATAPGALAPVGPASEGAIDRALAKVAFL